jgi:hypothetical protein
VPSVYTDWNQWLSSLLSYSLINFDGLVADGQSTLVPSPPGFTRDGMSVDLIDHSGSLFLEGKNYDYPGRSVLASQGVPGGNLHIVFPASTAIGLEIGLTADTVLTFKLSSGETYTRNVNASSINFFGVVSGSSFSSIDIFAPTGVSPIAYSRTMLLSVTYGSALGAPTVR